MRPSTASVCASCLECRRHPECIMNRFAAPLGFTLAAVWVVVVFVLVSATA